MKKIVSLILSLVMVLSMSVGISTSVKADAESITKQPVGEVVDANMSMSAFASLIKSNAGTIQIGDSDITITPDMCYLYGERIGVQAVRSNTPVIYPVPKSIYPSGLLNNIYQGDIDSFPITHVSTASGPLSSGALSVSELANQRCVDGVAAKVFDGSELFLVDGNYSLVVRYGSYHETINFTVSQLTGIRWPESLTKTQYFVGDGLDLTGDYVTLVYANGRTVQQPITSSMLHTIAGFYGKSVSENNTEGLNNNCYKLGGVFSANTAGTFDVVIRYPVKYNSNITTYKQLEHPNATVSLESGANRQYIDSSFKAGFFIVNRGAIKGGTYNPNNGNVYDNTLLEQVNAATSGTLDDFWKLSPTSLNGTKIYKITVLNANSYAPKLRYRAHVQNIGWQGWFYSPNEAGTDHQSLRMEAMQVQIVSRNASMGNIEYMAHIQNKGDSDWIEGDNVCGTEGQSLRMEGVAIRFTGKYADTYNVSYRVHIQGIGWTAWYKNGQYAGTRGEKRRLEAIEIDVSAK